MLYVFWNSPFSCTASQGLQHLMQYKLHLLRQQQLSWPDLQMTLGVRAFSWAVSKEKCLLKSSVLHQIQCCLVV